MRTITLQTIVLALANIVIATVVLQLWRTGQRHIQEPDHLVIVPPELPDISVLNSTPMRSVEVAAIRDHSIFHASRSFYEPPPPSMEIPPPTYEVAGTMKLTDGRRLAFVKQSADQGSRRIQVGDELEGWYVKSIEANRVILNHEEHFTELTVGSSVRSVGLLRGASATPRVAHNATHVLTGTTIVTTHARLPEIALQPRTYQPPPQVRK